MSNRNYDVTSLGELLIDFTENGTSAQGNPIMEANPGGAHVMFWLCLSALARRPLLSEKLERICSETS